MQKQQKVHCSQSPPPDPAPAPGSLLWARSAVRWREVKVTSLSQPRWGFVVLAMKNAPYFPKRWVSPLWLSHVGLRALPQGEMWWVMGAQAWGIPILPPVIRGCHQWSAVQSEVSQLSPPGSTAMGGVVRVGWVCVCAFILSLVMVTARTWLLHLCISAPVTGVSYRVQWPLRPEGGFCFSDHPNCWECALCPDTLMLVQALGGRGEVVMQFCSFVFWLVTAACVLQLPHLCV